MKSSGNIYLGDNIDVARRVNFADHYPCVNLLDWEDLINAITFLKGEDSLVFVEVIPDEDNETILYRVRAGTENVLIESVVSLGCAIVQAFLYNQMDNGFPIPPKHLTPLFEFDSTVYYLDDSFKMVGTEDGEIISTLRGDFGQEQDD